ncbi:Artemisinic aldehyde Delta(11(13)) reductase [Hypsizygus marmoreus]|uniref:Artemisinic aldehyde Delta(11(13)) reductase n=1 Tax=Hypsizygus marmoreus TaxID=39966 RepID=A0A369JCJ1_HYPMA|nr:Artemisinic aldehyde Delta(11(13)) reductase [Hypsizygus marmoreus]
MSSAASLFTPLKIGSIIIRNRITMSALTRNRALKTIPNDVMVEYYRQRAEGGAGLIVTEGTLVSRQGTEWPYAPGIWNKEQVAGWKKIVDTVHAAGSHIYSQLWHVGRVAHPDAPEQILAGVPVYAPSAIAARGGKFRHIAGLPGYVTPTAIEDPWTLVAQYKQAAINAKEAGFDGVEIHGANGYLVTQFLDSTANKRTDQWGGSVENRSRFGLEVLKAAIEVFGENVAIKLSPAGGYNDVGMPLQETLDTFNYFITEADKLKLAYITLVRYIEAYDVAFDGVKRSIVHDVLETYRPLIKNAKVFINAQVLPEEGAELVASGKADAIVIGINWILHPDLAKRVQHGKPLDNAPDYKHFQWGKDHSELGVGYTDYPAAKY